MSNPTVDSRSLFSKVVTNDATRKGVAGAVAGLLVALVSELLPWPKA